MEPQQQVDDAAAVSSSPKGESATTKYQEPPNTAKLYQEMQRANRKTAIEANRLIRQEIVEREKAYQKHEHELNVMIHLQQVEQREIDRQRRKAEAAERREELRESVPILLKAQREQDEKEARAELRREYAQSVCSCLCINSKM